MKRILLLLCVAALCFSGSAFAITDPGDGDDGVPEDIQNLVSGEVRGGDGFSIGYADVLDLVDEDQVQPSPVGGIIIITEEGDIHQCDLWCIIPPQNFGFRVLLDGSDEQQQDNQTYVCCAEAYVPDQPVEYVTNCHDGYWEEWGWVEGNC